MKYIRQTKAVVGQFHSRPYYEEEQAYSWEKPYGIPLPDQAILYSHQWRQGE